MELRLEDCAKDAGVHLRTVQKWARLKKFKVLKYGHRTRRVPSRSWEAFKERITK